MINAGTNPTKQCLKWLLKTRFTHKLKIWAILKYKEEETKPTKFLSTTDINSASVAAARYANWCSTDLRLMCYGCGIESGHIFYINPMFQNLFAEFFQLLFTVRICQIKKLWEQKVETLSIKYTHTHKNTVYTHENSYLIVIT